MRRSQLAGPLGAALVVGLLTSIQSRINGSLAQDIGGGLQAAAISFTIGMAALTLVVILSSRLRAAVGILRTSLRQRGLRWWQLTGGLLGAYFVLSQSIAVPAIGVGLFTVSLVAGLTVSSLIVDRLGLSPAGRQTVTVMRMLAALVSIAAVATAASSRLIDHSLSITFALLGFSAGVGVAVQQAFNGRVSAATGQPIIAGWVNFVLGSTTLVVVLLLGISTGAVVAPMFGAPSLWLYSGGLVGIVFISLAAWTAARIGVLRLSLISIAGQLLGALLLDLMFTEFVDTSLVLGVLLAFVAATLANIRSHYTAGRRIAEPQSTQE